MSLVPLPLGVEMIEKGGAPVLAFLPLRNDGFTLDLRGLLELPSVGEVDAVGPLQSLVKGQHNEEARPAMQAQDGLLRTIGNGRQTCITVRLTKAQIRNIVKS